MQNTAEYVSAKQLGERLGIGLSTVWSKVKRGQLPPADVKMGERCTRWNWNNVIEFLEEKTGKGGAA